MDTEGNYPMLTTVDNPYDPLSQYEKWLAYDLQRYNTNALLARISMDADTISYGESYQAYMTAIEEIVLMNPELYRVVRPKA